MISLRAALAAAFVLTLFTPPLARAEGKADKRMETARKVVRMVTTRDTYERTMDQMGAQMVAASRQQGAALPPDFTKKMKLVLNEALPYEEMVEWTAELYAKRFTYKELVKLQEFYKTPLGKKLAESLPDFAGETGKKMGALLPQRLPALMKKHGLMP